jgi:hypothetical protein
MMMMTIIIVAIILHCKLGCHFFFNNYTMLCTWEAIDFNNKTHS